MAQLIEIQKVEVGLEYLTARVRIADGAPLMTSDDLQATTRIYNLMPHIVDHVCLGDAGETFRDCMGATEVAHLLEHMTVELLAQTNIAGDITSGKTYPVSDDPRAFDVQLSCRDDVLTVGALSSAAWVADWAFSGGGDPQPDIEAIVEGLCGLVASLGEGPANRYAREVENDIEAALNEQYNIALAERQREIDERLQEIEAARVAAEAEAAKILAREEEERRAREAELRAQEEARRAEEERRAREEARRAEEERRAREAELRAQEEERRAREEARRAEEELLIAETRHAAEVAAERAAREAEERAEAERAAREAEERAEAERAAREAEERAEAERAAREAE
ncbi:MAG: hypothetical protein J6D54_04380, partial [Olsenella sp.]|nr:hypothetical protein [Olsenella sp.]